MVQPLNLLIDVPNPFEEIEKGIASSQGLIDREQTLADNQANRERTGVLQGREDVLFEQQQQDRQAQIAALAQQKADTIQMQKDFGAVLNNPLSTAQDFTTLSIKYPEFAELVQSDFDRMDDAKKIKFTLALSQAATALDSGNSDIAIGILQKRADALRTEKDDDGADEIEALIGSAKVAPILGANMIDATLAVIDADALDAATKQRGAALEKEQAELELAISKSKLNEIKVDVKKKLIELDGAGESGLLTDPKEIAEQEDKLRKEFAVENANFTKTQTAVRKIQSASDTGEGDLSLIFNFMKALDPGSVVRESEFALAETTAGIPQRILNMRNKALSGDRLGQVQRSNMKTEAHKLLAAADVRNKELIKGFNVIIKNRGFNPDNVFLIPDGQGEVAGTVTPPPTSPTGAGETDPFAAIRLNNPNAFGAAQ